MRKNEVVTFDLDSMTIYGERTNLSEAQTKEVMTMISERAEDMTKNQFAIAYGLLLLSERSDVKKLGYANLYEYGKQVLGMGRGTVSEALNMAKRFRTDSNKYTIGEKWQGYSKSVLVALCKSKLDDEEIEALNLPTDCKYMDVVEAIAKTKAIEAKSEEESESSDSELEKTAESESSDSEPTAEVKSEVEIIEVNYSEIPSYLKDAIGKYIRGKKKELYKVEVRINTAQ